MGVWSSGDGVAAGSLCPESLWERLIMPQTVRISSRHAMGPDHAVCVNTANPDRRKGRLAAVRVAPVHAWALNESTVGVETHADTRWFDTRGARRVLQVPDAPSPSVPRAQYTVAKR